MLVFIPSYSLINKLIKRWKQCGIYNRIAARKHIYIEPQHGPKANFELTLKGYCMKLDQPPPEDLSSTRDGCIMFAVYRGKVSEGIDFSDKYCRAVVNIGIPFPAYKDVKVKAKREYNDKRCTEGTLDNAISGGQWYEIQAYRAINQALGRCLRHKNDWGAIIFLESRFEMQNKVSQLSKWVRQHVRQFPLFEDALSSLSSYFAERKATYQAEMQQSNERAEKDTILIDLDLDDADSIITIAEEPAFDIDTEGHNDTPQDHSDLSAAARPITAITAPNLTHSSSVMQVDLLSSDDSDEGRGDARATFTTPIQTSRKASATNTEFYDCDYDYDLDVETGTQQWPAVACPDCKSPLLRPGYEGARIIRIDASYEIYPEMRAVHQSVRDICAPKDGSGSLDVVVVSQNHLANEFFRHQVRDFRPQFALNERCHKDVLTTEMIGCPFCFNDKSMLRNPQRRRLKRGTIFGLRILSYQQDPLAIPGADDLVAVYRPGDVWIPLGILTR
ncbi:hypothetical protein EV182_002015 [Spiromyces aspiralis]|uniref:Uncharacterized protein n=1 Tax=Spiromyces aspiralis TaxID=68401 RepID=A0ACC1HUX9_9FUNG|nr:hypothetical protein EV182_002015 [Spiromyces aspiralis]